MQQSIIYALSDSIGETAELVARATASQFDLSRFDIIRVPYINSVRQIEEVLKTASSTRSVVCHTLVSTKAAGGDGRAGERVRRRHHRHHGADDPGRPAGHRPHSQAAAPA